MKTEFYRTNTKSQGIVPAYFTLIIIIIAVHVVKHQSILINICGICVPRLAILNRAVSLISCTFSIFYIDNYYYCCACSKTSININKYMRNMCAQVGNSKQSCVSNFLYFFHFALSCKTKSALAFRSLSCLPCASYCFFVTAMYLP